MAKPRAKVEVKLYEDQIEFIKATGDALRTAQSLFGTVTPDPHHVQQIRTWMLEADNAEDFAKELQLAKESAQSMFNSTSADAILSAYEDLFCGDDDGDEN